MLNLFYRRITTEDLTDAPKGNWKEKLLYAINLFFQQVYSLLNNNLTPEQNCIEQTKTFTLIGNSVPSANVYSFTTSYQSNPNFIEYWIIPIDGSSPVFTAAPYASCQYVNGTINVVGICGLTTDVRYQVTIRVWWPQSTN